MASATEDKTPTPRPAPKRSAAKTAKATQGKSIKVKTEESTSVQPAAAMPASNGSVKPAATAGAGKTAEAKRTTKGTKPVVAKTVATRLAPAKSDSSKSAADKSAETKPAAAAKSEAPAEKAADRAVKPASRQSHDSSMNGKEHDERVERIWTLAKRIGIAMFVTWDGANQRARPLAATVEKEEGAIYFLTDVNGEKDEQISEFPMVSVTFADHRNSKFIALAGRATISNDRAKIKDLWSPFAKAWWSGPEDPAIRVIKMVPQDAELWDSPGRIVTTISMLTAAVTGRSPKIGENAKVVL